jgi:hypothetical protein
MITGIIGKNQYPPSSMAADLAKLFHKFPIGLGIE